MADTLLKRIPPVWGDEIIPKTKFDELRKAFQNQTKELLIYQMNANKVANRIKQQLSEFLECEPQNIRFIPSDSIGDSNESFGALDVWRFSEGWWKFGIQIRVLIQETMTHEHKLTLPFQVRKVGSDLTLFEAGFGNHSERFHIRFGTSHEANDLDNLCKFVFSKLIVYYKRDISEWAIEGGDGEVKIKGFHAYM